MAEDDFKVINEDCAKLNINGSIETPVFPNDSLNQTDLIKSGDSAMHKTKMSA